MQRTHFTAGYTLYNCVCEKKIIKKNNIGYRFFFYNRYPIMVKCLNIGKNIGKEIYQLISSEDMGSDARDGGNVYTECKHKSLRIKASTECMKLSKCTFIMNLLIFQKHHVEQ